MLCRSCWGLSGLLLAVCFTAASATASPEEYNQAVHRQWPQPIRQQYAAREVPSDAQHSVNGSGAAGLHYASERAYGRQLAAEVDDVIVEFGRAEQQQTGMQRARDRGELFKVAKPGEEEEEPDISAGTVMLMTLLMASAAGLGSLPFFFVGSLSKEWAALANAVACGVMLACSFDLMHEGQPYGGGLVVVGILIGALFISTSQQWLEKFEDVRFQGLQGINARKILLMIGIMAAHALGEGAGVGVSFCGSRGWAQGTLVTLAIGLHNVPEGLAVSTVLVARGIRPRTALLWTLFTSMPQPLLAVPSFLFVDTFRALLPVALGFAAGCMLWMVFAELLPDALADAAHGKVATVGTFSAAWLEGLRMMLATLEGGNGDLSMPTSFDRSVLLAGLGLMLPAVLAATAAGRLSSVVAGDMPSALGLAAGLTAWLGAAELGYQVIFGQAGSLGTILMGAAAGGLAVVALCRLQGHWLGSGLPKLKSQNSDLDQESSLDSMKVVVAAEQNGDAHFPADYRLREHANGHHVMEHDLELAGEKKIFVPYKQPVLPAPQQGLLTVGLAVLVLYTIAEGFRIAHAQAIAASPASALWVPVVLRALLVGMAAAALAAQTSSVLKRLLIAGGVGAVAPLVAFAEVLHLSMDGGGGFTRGNSLELFTSLAAGATLIAGTWLLWPAAKQQQKWRRAARGGLKGLFMGAAVYALLGSLCLQTPYCIR